MNTTTVPFDLRAWRRRMGWTQAQAAAQVGMSLRAYSTAEYRAMDRPNAPCTKTLALLCQYLETAHSDRREA